MSTKEPLEEWRMYGFVADVGERWVIVHDEPGQRVRRYRIPGRGYLYQVEIANESIASEDGWATKHVGWHPPVFVPCALKTVAESGDQ
jgi:hypothetical protein